MTKYGGPARPVSLSLDSFDDVWLAWSFTLVFVAFVWIVFVMGW